LAFDATGAMFWSAAYAALGYILSNQLEQLRGKLNAGEDILLLDL
jgi:membrane protein DedA with SNARE-associated domain